MQIIASRICLTALLLCFVPFASYADDLSDDCKSELTSAERNKKLWAVNLTGIAVITAWGVKNWDYFSTSPQATSEGWFQNDTKYGGADKLGHVYTSYVASHGLSYLYESWCINKKDAALYGALSSLAMVTYMELGDSFSDLGFSKEDMISNGVGVLYGYYSYINPELSNTLDLRWEYKPNSETFGDFTTDYENSKFLLALKLNAFSLARDNFLKHVELQVGYYTRGFSNPYAIRERNVFFGIGINLTDLARRHSYNKTATFLKYYQIPGTSVQFTNDLNR